jgi:hypothetical protein
MASASGRAEVITHAARRTVLRSARSTGRAWRGCTALLLVAVSPLAGCYTTRPVTTAPAPGATVILDLTDRGRVDLGDRIGPSAASIQGIVQTQSDSSYVLRVSSVSYLGGQQNKWAGESLTVPAALVSRARLREFSRSRTTAIGLGIAAALAAVFIQTDFFGLSGPEQQPTPPIGGET